VGQAEWTDGEIRVGSAARFVYPDHTYLDGSWDGDGLREATFLQDGDSPLTVNETAARFDFDESTATKISCVKVDVWLVHCRTVELRTSDFDAIVHRSHPLLADPYESNTIQVKVSKVLPDGAAGEGLFARVRGHAVTS